MALIGLLAWPGLSLVAAVGSGTGSNTSDESTKRAIVWHAIARADAVEGGTSQLVAGEGELLTGTLDAGELRESVGKSLQQTDALMPGEKLAWLQPTEGTGEPTPSQRHFSLTHHEQTDHEEGAYRRTVSLMLQSHYQMGVVQDKIQLDLELQGINARLDFIPLEGGDRLGAETSPAFQKIRRALTLLPGKAHVWLIPLNGSTEAEFFHVVGVEAVSVPRRDVDYLEALTLTERWLKGGLAHALEVVQSARKWHQYAPNKSDGAFAKGSEWPERADDGDGDPTTQIGSLGFVRVVAVGRPGRRPHRWWDIEGRPVRANPHWQKPADGSPVAIVYENHMAQGGVSVGLVTPDQPELGASGAGIYSSSELARDAAVYHVSSRHTKTWRDYFDHGGRIGFRVQVGSGKFQHVADIQDGERIEADGGRFHLESVQAKRSRSRTFFGLRSHPGLVLVDGTYDYDPGYQVVLQAVTKNGRRVEASGQSGSGVYDRREGRRWYFHLRVDKTRIDHFEILKRPIKAHVFDDLPAEPDRS